MTGSFDWIGPDGSLVAEGPIFDVTGPLDSGVSWSGTGVFATPPPGDTAAVRIGVIYLGLDQPPPPPGHLYLYETRVPVTFSGSGTGGTGGGPGGGGGSTPGSPAQNACLKPNRFGFDADTRAQLARIALDFRKATTQLETSADDLDVFWYIKQISASVGDLGDKISKPFERAEIAQAVLENRAAVASERTVALRSKLANLQIKFVPKGKRGQLLKQRTQLIKEINASEKTESLLNRSLDLLTRNRTVQLLRLAKQHPELGKLANTVARVEASISGPLERLTNLIDHNPAAKKLANFLSVIGDASLLASFLAALTDNWADLARTLSQAPPGCLVAADDQVPPFNTGNAFGRSGVRAATAATLRAPAYLTAPLPTAGLPAPFSVGKATGSSNSLLRALTDATGTTPAVLAGLQVRDTDSRARAALRRTLPHLASLLSGMSKLESSAKRALGIPPQTITADELRHYRPQAASRAALEHLGALPGVSPGISAALRTAYHHPQGLTGIQDPLAALSDPVLEHDEAELARMLTTLH